MKRYIYVLVLILLGMNINAQSVWNGKREAIKKGSGTAEDPYLIENAQNLAWFAYLINYDYGKWVDGKYFLLTTDIDLKGNKDNQWIPIGAGGSRSDSKTLNIEFDGGNHKITGLYIDKDSELNDENSIWYSGNVALFSKLGNTTIKNLYLEGTIQSENLACSAFSVSNAGFIENCAAFVNIETNGDAAGFVVGGKDNGGTIRNSYNLGDINGDLAGGLFCKGKVIIENCYNKGNVLGKEVAGGLAGQLLSGSGIKNAYNIGNVDASTDYYGAIVGQAHNSVKVENTHYLNTSLGKADKYAKEKTADFMRSQDFVNILNDNTDVWAKDEDEANDGYPILLPTKHLDVEEYFDTDNAVSIFPNPATDYINVSGEFVSCAIYDVVGNMVYSDENISDEAVNISVADYASGVYFVRCLARNGGVVTKKLVVK